MVYTKEHTRSSWKEPMSSTASAKVRETDREGGGEGRRELEKEERGN